MYFLDSCVIEIYGPSFPKSISMKIENMKSKVLQNLKNKTLKIFG